MRRRPLIWLALAGAFVLAALLGVRTWVLHDRTAPISVDRVLERYRGAEPAAAAATAPPGVPAAGVYAYTTTGGEQAELLGVSKHAYPGRTTLTVVPGGCGFTATWDALDRRSERWTVCARPGALTPTRLDEVHSFYGRTDRRSYRCRGGPVALKPGTGAQVLVCARSDTTRTDRLRVVGTTRLTVGGRDVDAVHLRVRSRMTGATAGTGATDAWLVAATGLPVRVVVHNDNRTDTPIGRPVHYVERYELRLRSLDPMR